MRGKRKLSCVVGVWCTLLVMNTCNHLVLPFGVSLCLPFHVGYWLGICGVGVLICPFVVWGLILFGSHLESTLRYQLFMYSVFTYDVFLCLL